ncbi:UNVERIFIED_CONTAM: hypothetical protein HDU68_001229 [Siphonaria sp. JEL0065]|nr:hypothetical protein HDU68_001229 [Siphonaria sp. JEL0065]
MALLSIAVSLILMKVQLVEGGPQMQGFRISALRDSATSSKTVERRISGASTVKETEDGCADYLEA